MFLGKIACTRTSAGYSRRKSSKDRGFRSMLEALEGRVVLSSSQALSSGVDSLRSGT